MLTSSEILQYNVNILYFKNSQDVKTYIIP